MWRTDSLEKTLMLEDWRWQKGMTEDEMVGWHHRLDRHAFEQAPGVGDGQGSLVYCSPRGCKKSDTTVRLNWKSTTFLYAYLISTASQEWWRQNAKFGVKATHFQGEETKVFVPHYCFFLLKQSAFLFYFFLFLLVGTVGRCRVGVGCSFQSSLN